MAAPTSGFKVNTLPSYQPMDPRMFTVQKQSPAASLLAGMQSFKQEQERQLKLEQMKLKSQADAAQAKILQARAKSIDEMLEVEQKSKDLQLKGLELQNKTAKATLPFLLQARRADVEKANAQARSYDAKAKSEAQKQENRGKMFPVFDPNGKEIPGMVTDQTGDLYRTEADGTLTPVSRITDKASSIPLNIPKETWDKMTFEERSFVRGYEAEDLTLRKDEEPRFIKLLQKYGLADSSEMPQNTTEQAAPKQGEVTGKIRFAAPQ